MSFLRVALCLSFVAVLAPVVGGSTVTEFEIRSGDAVGWTGFGNVRLGRSFGEVDVGGSEAFQMVNVSGTAVLRTVTTVVSRVGGGNVTHATDGTEEARWDFQDAKIVLLPGRRGARMSWDSAGVIILEGRGSTTQAPVWKVGAQRVEGGPLDAVLREAGGPAFHLATHSDGVRMGSPVFDDASMRFCGEFSANVTGGSVAVVSAGVTRRADLDGTRERVGAGPLAIERAVAHSLTLGLRGACAPVLLRHPWWIQARDVAVDWSGTTLFENASGALRAGTHRVSFERARVELVGDSHSRIGWSLVAPATGPGAAAYDGEGIFDVVLVNGAPIAIATRQHRVTTPVAASVLAGLAAWILYHRFSGTRVLDHAVRGEIVRLVTRHPGIHLRRLADEMQVAWSTARFHVHVLERNGFLRTRRDGRYLAVFPVDADAPLPVRNIVARAVLDAFPVDGTPVALAEVARGLHISRQLANHHVRGLVTRGLVERVERGKARRLP